MSNYEASLFDNSTLNAYAASSSPIYKRDATMVLNATRDTAVNIGTLTTDETQLDVRGQISRENSSHFYKFSLNGDNLKLAFSNNTASADLRVQIMNTQGVVVADSSTYASTAKQEAYAAATSSDGLDLKSGDYYVKVTFDSMAMRGVPQTYSLALYSGDNFQASYQTTTKSQTSTKQTVLTDDTMTYSLITAQEYSTQATHLANETVTSPVDIGWLSENKTALSVISQMTSVCDEQYYSVTLQKGDNLKMSFNNHTDTSALRVQLYDSTGSYLIADSNGTEKQKAAYESLTSSDGLSAKAGNYVVKVSYVQGEKKSNQIYDFKLFSGTTYNTLYETKVGTESAGTAILSGHLDAYNAKASIASYLATQLDSGDNSVLSYLASRFSTSS